jgi:hypothetical protein
MGFTFLADPSTLANRCRIAVGRGFISRGYKHKLDYKQTGAIMQIFTLITPCDKRDWRFIPEFPRVCLCSDVSNLPITGRFSHRFLDLSSLFKIIMTD